MIFIITKYGILCLKYMNHININQYCMCALSRNQERFAFVPFTKKTKEIIPLIQKKEKLFSFFFFFPTKVNFMCKRNSGLIALNMSLLYKGNVQGVPRLLVWNCHFQVCEHSLLICSLASWGDCQQGCQLLSCIVQGFPGHKDLDFFS